jgi:hypothetical protein
VKIEKILFLLNYINTNYKKLTFISSGFSKKKKILILVINQIFILKEKKKKKKSREKIENKYCVTAAET